MKISENNLLKLLDVQEKAIKVQGKEIIHLHSRINDLDKQIKELRTAIYEINSERRGFREY